MNELQTARATEWAKFPGVTVAEVPGLGPVLVERNPSRTTKGEFSGATVSVLDAQGARGWMTVRLTAGWGRDASPNVSTSGTNLTPADAMAYGMLLVYAVQAIIPTLTPSAD